MKKLVLFFILLILQANFIQCSSSSDELVQPQPQPSKSIPSELIGEWKINVVTSANNPNYQSGNDVGAYIKFKSDNTVEYIDGNKKYGYVSNAFIEKSIRNLDSTFTLWFSGGTESIKCRKSSKLNEQIEFEIDYASNSPYTDMILIGTKK